MNKKILLILLACTLQLPASETIQANKHEQGFFEHTGRTLAVFDIALRYIDQYRKDPKQTVFIPVFKLKDTLQVTRNPIQSFAHNKLRFIARQSKSISAGFYATIAAISYTVFGEIGKEIDSKIKSFEATANSSQHEEGVALLKSYSSLPFFTALAGAAHGAYRGCYPKTISIKKITSCQCGNQLIENLVKNKKNYRGLDPNKNFWESLIVKSFDGLLGGLCIDEIIHYSKQYFTAKQ